MSRDACTTQPTYGPLADAHAHAKAVDGRTQLTCDKNASSVSAVTTVDTSPDACASWAPSLRPVMSISFARDQPCEAGTPSAATATSKHAPDKNSQSFFLFFFNLLLLFTVLKHHAKRTKQPCASPNP